MLAWPVTASLQWFFVGLLSAFSGPGVYCRHMASAGFQKRFKNKYIYKKKKKKRKKLVFVVVVVVVLGGCFFEF